jgi:hypothetical protein
MRRFVNVVNVHIHRKTLKLISTELPPDDFYKEAAMGNPLLDRVIEAHGGLQRWHQVEAIQLSLNIFGPILITRFKSPWLSNITACIYTDKPYVSFHDFPEQGMTSIFDGYDVYIFDVNDHITMQRDFSLKANQQIKPRLRWDHLDLVYFLGYAVWNYICSPFMLNSDQFECFQGNDWLEGDGSRLATLHVTFPDNIPAHCKQQVFYFNDKGLLRRNDYTCNVISPVAIGAHYCNHHQTVEGLVFPTHRSVFPRLWNGKALTPFKVMDGYIKNIAIEWKTLTC